MATTSGKLTDLETLEEEEGEDKRQQQPTSCCQPTTEDSGMKAKSWSLCLPEPVLDDVNQQLGILKDSFMRQNVDKDQEIEELQRHLYQGHQKLEKLECDLDKQLVFLRQQKGRLANTVPQSRTNIFQWRINDWAREVSDAKFAASASTSSERKALSSPVLTVADGYHCFLKLFPNGKRSCDNGYVSLFFYLTAGQHDHLLSWPFSYSCEISIVNYGDDAKSLCRKVPGPTKSGYQDCWKRPRHTNPGAGSNDFASHQQLVSLTRNNSLLVRLSVEC